MGEGRVETPRLADALREAAQRFEASGSPTPALDARLLLERALGDGSPLARHARDAALDEAASARFLGFVARRADGEPVHRILGERGFYAHDFYLSPETLEPRPDTETLVELAIAVARRIVLRKGACRLADIGTGTGAIAVSILSACPQAEAIASDISEGALATARRNALRAGVADRFQPVRSNYLDALGGPFDLIVSNPPYIASHDIAALDRGVRDHDPILALDGGADGLDAYRALAREAGRALAPHGAIGLEIGQGQGGDVARLFAAEGFSLSCRRSDLGGVERALLFERGDGRE